jgi:hypothetical protein
MGLPPVTSTVFLIAVILVKRGRLRGIRGSSVTGMYLCTVKSSSDKTTWTLYRSYFKGISANIELQVLA